MAFKYSLSENEKKEPHKVDGGYTGDIHRQSSKKSGSLREVGYYDTIKVRNVEETSDEHSVFKHEWAGFWQDKTWLKFPSVCANSDCTNDTESPEIVGAHVRINGEPDNDKMAWIVPLCKSCNSSDNKSEMELSLGTWMARVTMSKAHKTAKEEKD